MLGITLDKVVILVVIAAVLLGPERLPYYAERLGAAVKRGKGLVSEARDRAREELGPEFDEIDWTQLDPRRYDPRQIIRNALADEPSSAPPRKAQSDPEPASAGSSVDGESRAG